LKRTSAFSLFGLVLVLSSCAATPPTVTLDEYNRLQNSITYNEASSIIGEPGQEMSRVELPGTPSTIMYSWQNADGSNMNATFQDDKLVTKAQFGLK
jgi:hypothetical protein